MAATFESAKPAFAGINWQQLPEPVEHRCCESTRIRQIAASALTAFTIASAAATIYAAFYLTAVPFTLMISVTGLAALTTAFAVATIVVSNMKALPNDPEVLLKKRNALFQKLQQNQDLGAEEMRNTCPSLKAFSNEEMNLVMWQDAQTMDYAPFMQKHGHVLDILDEDNLQGLRPQFIAHLVDTTLIKEHKTWEQIAALPESQKFGITKEDLNDSLGDDTIELPYLEFITKYGFSTLSILNEENLAGMRVKYAFYLQEVCIDQEGKPIAQILEMPASKIFDIKAEELAVGLDPRVQECPTYSSFVEKYGVEELATLNAFSLAQLHPSFVQFVIHTCIQTDHMRLQEILDMPASKAFKVKKEEFKALVAVDQLQVLMHKGKFEDFDSAVLDQLPNLPDAGEIGAGKKYLESKYLEFILNKKEGLLAFEARKDEHQFFSKEVVEKIAVFTIGHEVVAFMEGKYDYFTFRERNGLKGVKALVTDDEGRTAKALAQFLLKAFTEQLTPLVSDEYAEDRMLLGLTKEEIQKVIATDVDNVDTFQELVEKIDPIVLAQIQTPKSASLVIQYVLASPIFFLMEGTHADKYASIIMKHNLMPEELALHVKAMRQKYEAEMSLYKNTKEQLETSAEKQVKGFSQEKEEAFAVAKHDVGLQAKQDAFQTASKDYQTALIAKKELNDKLLAAQTKDKTLDSQALTAADELSKIFQKHLELTEKPVNLKQEIDKLKTDIAGKQELIATILRVTDLPIEAMQQEMGVLQATSVELQKAAAGYQRRLLLQEQLDQLPYQVGTAAFDQKKAELQQQVAYAESHETDSISPHIASLNELIATEKEFTRMMKEIQQLPSKDISSECSAIDAQMKELQQKIEEASKARAEAYQKRCIAFEIPQLNQTLADLKKSLKSCSDNQIEIEQLETALAAAREKAKKLVEEGQPVKQQIKDLESQIWQAGSEESAAKMSSDQALKDLKEAEQQLALMEKSIYENFGKLCLELTQGHDKKLAQLETQHLTTVAVLTQEFTSKQFIQAG